jgi:Leucine-rich repeat (LRR) protein
LAACGSSGDVGGVGGGIVAEVVSKTSVTTVSGTTLDLQDTPVSGAEVTISSDPVTVVTAANGTFTAEVVVGEHEIVVAKDSTIIYTGTFTCVKGIPKVLGDIQTSYLNGDTQPVVSITSPTVDVTINEDQSLNFRGSVTDGNFPLTYSWDFDGGASNLALQNPLGVTFSTEGTYTVTFAATDFNGDSDSADMTVNVVASPIPIAGIFFADSELGDCVANKGYTDTSDFDSLECDSGSIIVLSGLENLTYLKELNLDDNSISDVTPLASLTGLAQLDLFGNSISDVGPLASLLGLTELELSYNSISDITLLASLTGLTELELSYNSISNVTPLASLTVLTYLSLANNSISDVTSLASLPVLTDLYLANNSISDVTSLASLTGLISLSLGNNDITTGVAALASLTSATYIDLWGNDNIPCDDLDILINEFGAGVVNEPASCQP